MIALGDVLISDEIIESQFVCNLTKCKGGCCVDGDCGAPLTKAETKILKSIYPKIQHFIPDKFQQEIALQGTHTQDSEYGYVTPTVDGGVCVYGYYDELGVVKCAIEKGWQEGLIDFPKPLSCHLFPIRLKEKKGYTFANYEPRTKLCAPACTLGRELQIPVYVFLKAPLIRKFGLEFYNELEQMAQDYAAFKNKA